MAIKHIGVALLLAIGLGVSACERSGESSAPSRPTAAVPRGTEEPMPAEGSAVVRAEGGNVTVLANGVPLSVVLEQLADAAGFEIRAAEFASRPITQRLQDLTVTDALARLLADHAFDARYEFDGLARRHVVREVWIGAHPARVSPEALAPADDPESARRRMSDAIRARMAKRIATREAAGQALSDPEILDRLASSDPVARTQAIDALDPDIGADISHLSDTLSNDPEPSVRAAAAERLGDSDSYGSVHSLINALSDPDKSVVLAAIDAIEFAGDGSVVKFLEPLRNHPDAEISSAVGDAIEFLGE